VDDTLAHPAIVSIGRLDAATCGDNIPLHYSTHVFLQDWPR